MNNCNAPLANFVNRALQNAGMMMMMISKSGSFSAWIHTRGHSLTNKQLFNFSENRRPEVVFIGINYVTFVSGYDPSANLSVVLLFGVLLRFNKILVSVCP